MDGRRTSEPKPIPSQRIFATLEIGIAQDVDGYEHSFHFDSRSAGDNDAIPLLLPEIDF